MRFLALIVIFTLSGCQFSVNHNNLKSDNRARSGTHGFENGSIRVFGKSWGNYGRSLARAAAYERLYKLASRTGHTHFYLESEKKRHIATGGWSLLPLATKTDDYHSLRLHARLYKGSKGTPGRALRIDWLRQQIEKSKLGSHPPNTSLRETITREKEQIPKKLERRRKSVKPVKILRAEMPAPVPTEKPLVIRAPES